MGGWRIRCLRKQFVPSATKGGEKTLLRYDHQEGTNPTHRPRHRKNQGFDTTPDTQPSKRITVAQDEIGKVERLDV